MKILMFAGLFYPKIAGSGTATYQIAKDLAGRGHSITIAVDRSYEHLLARENLPFQMLYLDHYTDFMTGQASLKSPTVQIDAALEKTSYDLIHVFSYMPMLLLSLMRPSFDIPVIFTFWNTPYKGERSLGFYDQPHLDTGLAGSILRLKKYHRLILGSKCSYDSALLLGADPSITDFTYHGINLSDFQKDLDSSLATDLINYFGDNLNPQDILITLPGRVTPRKGLLEAIRALREVNQRIPVKLLLTGMADPYSPAFHDQVLQEADSLNVRDRLLIPHQLIARHHMAAVFKRSDLVITPSYYEGLGFTAIEALAAGRPLIATNAPGLNEVGRHRHNCLLVPPRNSPALAAAIIELLTDPNLAQRLAAAGPASIKKFDMKRFVDFLESRYQLAQV